MPLLSLLRLRQMAWLMLLVTVLLGCTSPEDGRARGGGPGADVGNRAAPFKPDSKVFSAAPRH